MKPRMLKTKMIEDIEDKYNEINELHFVLKHYKDEAAKALDVAKNCRVVVSKIMNKYLVEKSELQSCMKDLNYHYATIWFIVLIKLFHKNENFLSINI